MGWDPWPTRATRMGQLFWDWEDVRLFLTFVPARMKSDQMRSVVIMYRPVSGPPPSNNNMGFRSPVMARIKVKSVVYILAWVECMWSPVSMSRIIIEVNTILSSQDQIKPILKQVYISTIDKIKYKPSDLILQKKVFEHWIKHEYSRDGFVDLDDKMLVP